MNYVYRYMLGDQWIYVGKSENRLDERIKDHAKDVRFALYANSTIQYAELSSRRDMDITEAVLIKIMRPVINVADITDGDIPFVYDESLIKWHEYKLSPRITPVNPNIYNDLFEVFRKKIDDIICDYERQQLNMWHVSIFISIGELEKLNPTACYVDWRKYIYNRTSVFLAQSRKAYTIATYTTYNGYNIFIRRKNRDYIHPLLL